MVGMFASHGQLRYRARQILRQLDLRVNPDVDHALRSLLTPEQWSLVARLSPADRSHLLHVHRQLVHAGHTDPDLLLAALLHDVGKADDRGRVMLVHRILKIILRTADSERLATRGDGWLGHGMYLAMRHSSLGAELARDAGASERVCWLIAHHDDGTIPEDEALAALQAIDAKG